MLQLTEKWIKINGDTGIKVWNVNINVSLNDKNVTKLYQNKKLQKNSMIKFSSFSPVSIFYFSVSYLGY